MVINVNIYPEKHVLWSEINFGRRIFWRFFVNCAKMKEQQNLAAVNIGEFFKNAKIAKLKCAPNFLVLQ